MILLKQSYGTVIQSLIKRGLLIAFVAIIFVQKSYSQHQIGAEPLLGSMRHESSVYYDINTFVFGLNIHYRTLIKSFAFKGTLQVLNESNGEIENDGESRAGKVITSYQSAIKINLGLSIQKLFFNNFFYLEGGLNIGYSNHPTYSGYSYLYQTGEKISNFTVGSTAGFDNGFHISTGINIRPYKNITISPTITYQYNYNWGTVNARVNYLDGSGENISRQTGIREASVFAGISMFYQLHKQ